MTLALSSMHSERLIILSSGIAVYNMHYFRSN